MKINKKFIFIASSILLVFLLMLGVSLFFGKIKTVDKDLEERASLDEQEFVQEQDLINLDQHINEIAPEEINWPTIQFDILDNKDIVNILLIGQDKRDEERQRSDTMILVTINKKTNSIKFTSFMRDLYVQIPGYSDNRMNAAYQLGGMGLLDEVLKVNFGIEVDGNVEVDFSGFIEMIDLVGGVDVELSQEEIDYISVSNKNNFKVGINTLNGRQALTHARNRTVGNSDYERTERQREVLISLFSKAKESNLKTLLALAEKSCDIITTDMSKKEILGYVYNIFSLDIENIQNYRIPQDGAYSSARIREMSVLVPDLNKCQAYLKTCLEQ